MHASPKNSSHFSREPWRVLPRTLEGSPKNLGGFSREPWSLLWRTLESSLENLGVFSGEHWSLLRRTLESSPENIGVSPKNISVSKSRQQKTNLLISYNQIFIIKITAKSAFSHYAFLGEFYSAISFCRAI